MHWHGVSLKTLFLHCILEKKNSINRLIYFSVHIFSTYFFLKTFADGGRGGVGGEGGVVNMVKHSNSFPQCLIGHY